MAGFLVLEGSTREPGSASSLRASAEDQGTTRMIGVAYGLAAELPLLLRRTPLPQLPRLVAPAGLLLEAAGLGLRAWSMRSLGELYSRTLRTEGARHRVIDTGPYRFIRHPGYTGSLLTWTGFALTSRSAPVVALVGGLMGRAYRQRITVEEDLLRRELPGYAGYSDRTKKLLPFVW
ncbi:MAG: methyltransferase family protein [Acidimicrobiales bacterium]